MTSPRPELQRALSFLSSSALTTTGDQSPLPAAPDYNALAQRARASGHDLSPSAIEEAFRLVMCARLAVLGKTP